MSGSASRKRLPICASLLSFVCTLACSPGDDELRLVGTVERTAIELVAPVSEVVVEVAVERGDRVAPGEVLLRLDGTLASAEAARTEATLAGARTAAEVAEQELTRLKRLQRQRVASEQELDRARLERDEARARLRAAQAEFEAARKRTADLTLSAPTAAVVDQLPYELGERVPAGAVLVVLLEEAAPWVRVWVPETRLPLVAPGTPAEIRIDGLATPLAGRVLDVAREPSFTPHYALTERDRVHLVYETRVRIEDAPPGLRPGGAADVWLKAGPPPSSSGP